MGNQKKMNFKKLEVLAQNQKCVFCHTSEINEIKLGPVYMYQNIITHYYCLLLSSNMQQNGQDSDGILGFLLSDIKKEIKRGKRLACTYCRKSGATLGCDVTRCKVAFHLPCGIENNSLHQFFNSFKSFCQHHRPIQKIPKEIINEANKESFTNCTICCEKIEPRPVFDTLWAPCCKKNTWFHRDCVQKLATSAGYFFKCPMCNNKEDFSRTMRDFGIYIPEQDASWESVPNAFGDLYHRHDSCNASRCLCPQGRNDNVSGTRWELVLCRLCGSQGMHIGCGKLVWVDPVWECKECTQMLQTAKQDPTPASNNKDILRTLPTHERFATTHPSVSSDRLGDISDEDHKDHAIRRRRRIVDFQSKPIPGTSKTFLISDSPEPDKKFIFSDTIIIDDSEDECDDDDDIVVVSSEIPIKTAIVTKEGTKIPIVTINEKRVNDIEIEVPVQIKMADHIQPKKIKLDSVLINNNHSVLFENSNTPSNSVLQHSSRPVMQNYTCVPSSSMTSQDLYGNTYVLDPSHNVEGYPPGTAVYQSIPQEYLQNNQVQQDENRDVHHQPVKNYFSCDSNSSWARHGPLMTYPAMPAIQISVNTGQGAAINQTMSQPPSTSLQTQDMCQSTRQNNSSLVPKTQTTPTVQDTSGQISKLFSANTNKSFRDSIQYVKQLGYNYNRLNPNLIISPLKIWRNDKGNVKIFVLPFARNNLKRMKRLITCTNPIKKPKLDFISYKKERKLKINKDKPSLKRKKVLLKSRLKVKMFGANWVNKVKRKENLLNIKLENGNPYSPCTLDKEMIQFPILTSILDNKHISVVNSNIVDVSYKVNGDTSMLTFDSLNNIDENIKKINNFYENKIVNLKRISADDKHSVTINDNNTLSSFCDHSTNESYPNIATQENTLECKHLLELIKKEKPDVKLCLLAENEICTVKSKEIIPNLDSVSLTQKENSLISCKTFKNKKAITVKRKINSTKYKNKSSLNISRENKSHINDQIFSNESKTSKNKKNTLFNNSKPPKKQNKKRSKQIMGPSIFRTLDTFFKVLKPVDNLQNIDMSNTPQNTNKTIEYGNQIVQHKNEKHYDTVETCDENPDSNKTISGKQNLIETYLNSSKQDYNIPDAGSKNKIEEINPDVTEKADKFKIDQTNQKFNRKEIITCTEFMQKVQSKSKTNKHKIQAQIQNQLKLGCQDIKEFTHKRGKGKNHINEKRIIKKPQEQLICKNNEQIQNLKCTDLEVKETEMKKYTQQVHNFHDREGTQEFNSFELCISSNDTIENFISKSNGSKFKNEKNQTVSIIDNDQNGFFAKDSNFDLEKNKQLLLNSTFHKPNQLNTNEKHDKGVINNETVTSDSLFKKKFCFTKREPLSELVEMSRETSLNNIKCNLKHKKMTKFRTTNHLKFNGKSKGSKLIIKLFNTKTNIGGNKSK